MDRRMDWKQNSDNKEMPQREQMAYRKEYILIYCWNKKDTRV